MMEIKRRHPIRNSKTRGIVEKLKPKLGEAIESLLEGRVEIAEIGSEEKVILADGSPALIKKEGEYFPLTSTADRLSLKRVTVDMGAVKPISDGADVMAPGVVEADEEIKKGQIVGIEDEKNSKIIAIGTALKDGPYLKGEKGKVIKNIHYVGDRYWALREKLGKS